MERIISNPRRPVAAALIVAAAAIVALRIYWRETVLVSGLTINYFRTLDAPAGTLKIDRAPAVGESDPPDPPPSSGAPLPPAPSPDWPSYNRTLTSQRFSPLRQIDTQNAGRLQVLCTYDTREYSSFQSGLIVVDGALIGTTGHDIFSINPATCSENWRVHERLQRSWINRGVAYLDGRLYRGIGDGRVVAYDFQTGAQVWQTTLADNQHGETIPAAPIAWNGLVFIGNAGGDERGGKGRMYALDAKSGQVVWEFYLVPKGPGDTARGPQGASSLDASSWGNQAGTQITGGATWTSYTLDPDTGELFVPTGNAAPDFAPSLRKGANLYTNSVVVLDAKTGAYKRHFSIAPADWHDWDVSNAPAVLHTRTGKRILAIAPKDGHLYGFSLDSSALLYRTPINTIENVDETFAVDKQVRFCPGSRGGAEWNGPAYDPQSNLILVGEVDWCSTVTLQTDTQINAVKLGRVWSGMATHNPYHTYGVQDPVRNWGGWLYASDADTGAWKWRARTNYPIQGGITATAGGVTFFGDMGGNFYALNTATGQPLLQRNLGGAIAGGVITYSASSVQKVAVAAGFTSILWPTKIVTGKIVIFGLRDAS